MPHFGARLGQLIYRKREERGWSLAELAVVAYGDDGAGGETRKSDVQKIEQGKSAKPNTRTIKRYRDALNLTQDEIDACRTTQEIEFAHYAERLFDVLKGAVAQSGVADDFAIDLANRFAEGNPDNFDTALNELARALQVASDQAQRGALPSNTDEAVDAAIAEVDRRNQEESLDSGTAYLNAALDKARDEADRAQAKTLRLLDKALAQAVLARDVDGAVALELEKLKRDAPANGFVALRAIQDKWYVQGRDKGLRFDLEVSIGLAEQQMVSAKTPDERGAALNDLAISLNTLGERESGTARLEEAVTAFRDALLERRRDRVPLDWAMTQNNLGNALQTLGQRESGTARLEEAVTAYRNALEEYTRDRVPLQWASTQNNLGTGAIAFFDKTGDVVHLEQAERHLRAAREVFEEAGATQYLGMADRQLAKIAERRGGSE